MAAPADQASAARDGEPGFAPSEASGAEIPLIACHECDAIYRREPIAPGAKATCKRCGALLYRGVPASLDRSLALYLASLVLLLIANTFPFLALKVGGIVEEDHVIGGGLALVDFGMAELGLVVFLTSIAFPFVTIAGTLYLLIASRLDVVAPGMRLVYRVVNALGSWSLIGVFLLGTLIAIVKLKDLATVVPGPGLYALFALVVVYAAARTGFDPEVIWRPLRLRRLTEADLPAAGRVLHCHSCGLLNRASQHPHPQCARCHAPLHPRLANSVQRTWALMAAAVVMLIPANLLPVMTFKKLGQGEPSTILGGVVHLVEDGAWGLGLIVFFASVAVPVAKLVSLSLLLRSIRSGATWRPKDRTALYRATEMIGAWSMIDVFLVALLAGLVSLGLVASIEPGLGVTFFGAAVILTMFAAHSFDPRLIWDHADLNPQPNGSTQAAAEPAA
ncbi:MAG: paraquat-inducible protein A [Pseudomonadota bacterium]